METKVSIMVNQNFTKKKYNNKVSFIPILWEWSHNFTVTMIIQEKIITLEESQNITIKSFIYKKVPLLSNIFTIAKSKKWYYKNITCILLTLFSQYI